MPYTIEPKERYAKAFGSNLKISRKNAVIICRVIRNKKLKVAKRLLEGLLVKRRDLDGKYYTKTVSEMLRLLKSCEKNADALNLDKEKLFVHTSAHLGTIMRRRRRKSGFGSRMKMTNVEIFLIERGKSKAQMTPAQERTKGVGGTASGGVEKTEKHAKKDESKVEVKSES